MGQRKCSFAVLFGVLCFCIMKLVLSKNIFSNQNIAKNVRFSFFDVPFLSVVENGGCYCSVPVCFFVSFCLRV